MLVSQRCNNKIAYILIHIQDDDQGIWNVRMEGTTATEARMSLTEKQVGGESIGSSLTYSVKENWHSDRSQHDKIKDPTKTKNLVYNRLCIWRDLDIFKAPKNAHCNALSWLWLLSCVVELRGNRFPSPYNRVTNIVSHNTDSSTIKSTIYSHTVLKQCRSPFKYSSH